MATPRRPARRVTLAVAAAGLFVGGVAMPSAKAADLSSDCCADLKEWVDELEEITPSERKGNRERSVTITGQVNKTVIWWDRVYDRLAVGPIFKIGFEIMLDNQGGSDPKRVGLIFSVRRMIFWVDDAKLGRISVGHCEMAGENTYIFFGL